jgi:hypothetical protein
MTGVIKVLIFDWLNPCVGRLVVGTVVTAELQQSLAP